MLVEIRLAVVKLFFAMVTRMEFCALSVDGKLQR
jgi:hypothetical protein